MNNKKRTNKIKIFFIFSLFIFFILPTSRVYATNLSGRILLQVESHGEAWYVNPQNEARYYLGRPHDAFALIRELGLGVSNKDIRDFLISTAPSRLSGRILLQVEDKGQSYYVNPLNLKLYYLGRPSDAFSLMRNLGLGISNKDISRLKVETLSSLNKNNEAENSPNNLIVKDFSFKYKNKEELLRLRLSSDIYQSYKESPKIFTYQANKPPKDIQETFYKLFLETKPGDDSVSDIVLSLRKIALSNNLSDDDLLELALSFIQYIPYDNIKASKPEPEPYYPYETIYLNRGVCSDKTFLAYQVLDKMGYGVAIIDMPDINHSAIGIACEKKYSLHDSGYCYAETTNYFPISVIPQNIDSGQAENTAYNFSNLFSSASLGNVEIRNKKFGLQYMGASAVFRQADDLNKAYLDLIGSKLGENRTYQEVFLYNSKVETFNNLLNSFYQN